MALGLAGAFAAFAASIAIALVVPSGATPLADRGSPRPSPVATQAGDVDEENAQIFPPGSAIDIAANRTPLVTGTVGNLPTGHELWLFVEIPGVERFYAGNGPAVVSPSGAWKASIHIEEPGKFIVWAVDLGPRAISVLHQDTRYQQTGFPTLKFSPDVTILTSAPLTAHR
jgi:hypothetical protein